jgi:hypothetical protein
MTKQAVGLLSLPEGEDRAMSFKQFKQFKPFDIVDRSPHMFFSMGLKCYDRTDATFLEIMKKAVKGKGPLPHRQMFISAAMIVVEMYLADPRTESIHPFFKVRPGKGVEMTGVKAEANIS